MAYQGQPARPTTYKGIRMRSRLEARMAAFLDANSAWRGWEYEPRAYADESGQWLPDFVVPADTSIAGRSRPLFLEVKPTRDMARAAQEAIRRVFASEPDALAMALWPVDEAWMGVLHDQWGFCRTVLL